MNNADILIEPVIVDKLIELAAGKTVLEIGTFLGHSAKAMASTAKHVTTVDNYSGGWATSVPTMEQVQATLANEVAAGKVTILKYDSTDPRLKMELGDFDMVFIDGCHDYEIVRQDIALALSVLKEDGILCGHDWQLEGVRRAILEQVGHVQRVGVYPLWWVHKNEMSPTRFCHGGSAGDLLAALAPLSRLGKIEFFINAQAHEHWRIRPEVAQSLLRLLEVQPYISRCGICQGNSELVDLDGWRKDWRHYRNLADMHSEFLGLPHIDRETKWLTAPANKVAKVIIHRSPRYHNNQFPWRRVLDRFGKDAIFVGQRQERDAFCSEFGDVPYYPTQTYLDLASVIEGSELCIMNQSSPAWVCEGLKRPRILESMPRGHWAGNVHWDRRNTWYCGWTDHDDREFAKWLG